MVTASALIATLFFGGWDIPFTTWDNLAPWSILKTVLTLGAFVTKVAFFLFFFMWIRWTLPRFRYDQLMSLGWKFLLPLMLGYIVLIAGVTLALDFAGIERGIVFGLILFGMNLVLVVALLLIFDRGRIISPAYRPVRGARLAALQQTPVKSGQGGD
jgi:NADH-quinone oxidoreductase subunit H